MIIYFNSHLHHKIIIRMPFITTINAWILLSFLSIGNIENNPSLPENKNIDMAAVMGDDNMCPQPSSLMIDNITETMADISWSVGGNCSTGAEYWVRSATGTPAIGTGTTISCNPNFPIIESGLDENTQYYVFAAEDCGNNGNSSVKYLGAFDTEEFCPAPIGLSATNITGNSANISWSIGGKCQVESEYWVQTSGIPPAMGSGTSTGCTPTFPIAISNLIINTNYKVFVYEDCGANHTVGPVLVGSFTTDDECAPPSDLVVDNITETMVNLTWSTGGNCAVDAQYWVSTSSATPAINSGINIDCAPSFPVIEDNLTKATTYYVFGYENCGNGIAVGPEYLGDFTTENYCPEPANLISTNITGTTVDISWTLGGSCTDGIEYWIIESGTAPSIGTGTSIGCTPTFPLAITGLDIEKTYNVFVYEDCGAHDIGPILIGSFTTVDLCPIPNNFTVSNITGTTAVINWNVNLYCEEGMTYWVQMDNTTPIIGVGGVSISCSDPLPITLTDLDESTSYFVFIYKECEGNQMIGPVLLGSFSTICPSSSDLVVDNITGLMAELSWTTGGGCSQDIEYWTKSTSTSPHSSSTGEYLGCLPDFPIVETGLQPLTKYWVFVRENCGSGNSGIQSIGDFTTTDDTLFMFSAISSNLWSDTGNWNQAMLPGITDTVIIDQADANPIIDIDVTVSAVTLISGSLMINQNVVLTILNND